MTRSVGSTETIFPIPLTAASQEALTEMFVGIFQQMELKVDSMAREVAEKAVEQLVRHRQQLVEGVHPMQQGQGGG